MGIEDREFIGNPFEQYVESDDEFELTNVSGQQLVGFDEFEELDANPIFDGVDDDDINVWGFGVVQVGDLEDFHDLVATDDTDDDFDDDCEYSDYEMSVDPEEDEYSDIEDSRSSSGTSNVEDSVTNKGDAESEPSANCSDDEPLPSIPSDDNRTIDSSTS